MHYYTYTLPLEQGIYGGKRYCAYSYDPNKFTNAEIAIFEQITDQIELMSGDTSMIQMSYCDIVGIKAKKDNPITEAELPHILYNAQYKTDYLKGYLNNTKLPLKTTDCIGRYFEIIEYRIEYVLLIPDKAQLQPLNLEVGTTLNADEKWLIPPHYEVQRRPTILEQYFKPIVVKSATLTTQQIGQLLKTHPLKWQYRTTIPLIERIACFLHDKGFYNGPPIFGAELRGAMQRFMKEHQLPTFCGVDTYSALTSWMKREGY